jgi:hypothetical protein
MFIERISRALRPVFLSGLATSLSVSVAFGGEGGAFNGAGGGDAAHAKKITTDQLKQAIESAKSGALIWLNGYEIRIREQIRIFGFGSGKVDPAFEKIFLGSRTIYDVLRDNKIELRTDRACVDKNGKKRDASIVSETPNAICFSAPRLVKRLSMENYKYRLVALAIHEASHLVGTSEEEAVRLETLAINDLQNFDLERENLMQSLLLMSTYKIAENLKGFAKAPKTPENCSLIQDTVDKIKYFTARYDGKPFSDISFEAFSRKETLAMRVTSYILYSCTFPLGMKWLLPLSYDDVFGKDSSLTVAEFAARENQWFGSGDFSKQTPAIEKIESASDLDAEIAISLNELKHLEQDIVYNEVSKFEIVLKK